MSGLRRDQLQGLLSRGYEQAFQAAVLASYDKVTERQESEQTERRAKIMLVQ